MLSARSVRPSAVVGALLLTALAAVPAQAAVAPDERRATWSVQPATAKGLDTRPNVSVAAVPGRRIVDYVAVSNYGTRPLRLDLYATDAFTTEQGEFSLLPAATDPTDAGRWIELKRNRVRVPARSRTTVPFSIEVPADAAPGDHAAGIVASLSGDAGTGAVGRVAVEQRVGTRVYVRVLGEATATVAVEDVQVSYDAAANPLDGVATVTATIRNTGTTRLTGTRTVEVAGPFGVGRTTGDPVAVTELLPGSEVRVVQRLTGVPASVRLTATVDVTARPSGAESSPATVSATAGTWAISWAAVVLALLIVLVGAVLVRVRQRVRADRTRPPA